MTVTVHKLQIALDSEASTVQSALTRLSLEADTQTTAGLWQLLQRVVRSLLEHTHFWTHATTFSRTFEESNEAQAFFDLLSVEERSKFSAETLTNIDGYITQTPPPATIESGSPAYIVVTLLVGTDGDWLRWDRRDDTPLSTSQLTQQLETLARMPAESLAILELLWSPQTATDSLSAEEMSAQYADLLEIV
ncbi:MAG: DUF1517 domain-containing protein [Cyanobacteriota bacterium]|nr:DUF1517 domain-containing protein [Cyanobacteriota bacterium]